MLLSPQMENSRVWNIGLNLGFIWIRAAPKLHCSPYAAQSLSFPPHVFLFTALIYPQIADWFGLLVGLNMGFVWIRDWLKLHWFRGFVWVISLRQFHQLFRSSRFDGIINCLGKNRTVFRPGLNQEVEPWKPGIRLKSSFLSIENRAYVAISWTPKIGIGPHGSCKTGGKNHAVQPLSNIFFF